MKILVIGSGVIGATYGWQLANAGHSVTLFVRAEKKALLARTGLEIECRDERMKPAQTQSVVFRPAFVERFSADDGYELILVCVRSHQLASVLPLLAEGAGRADVLFFQNNWWGDHQIRDYLPERRSFFGFSRLVGGWKQDNHIHCVIFNGPGQATMLGEKDGLPSTRLLKTQALMAAANLKPELSTNILGWLMAHYVEYLGPVGAILQAGSAAEFVASRTLIKEAILATRDGLNVCRARGLRVDKAAPLNLRLFDLPTFITVPLGKLSYGMPSIQQFFDENIAHGMDEIVCQYDDVVREGRRLGMPTPHLDAFEPYYAPYRPRVEARPRRQRAEALRTVEPMQEKSLVY